MIYRLLRELRLHRSPVVLAEKLSVPLETVRLMLRILEQKGYVTSSWTGMDSDDKGGKHSICLGCPLAAASACGCSKLSRGESCGVWGDKVAFSKELPADELRWELTEVGYKALR